MDSPSPRILAPDQARSAALAALPADPHAQLRHLWAQALEGARVAGFTLHVRADAAEQETFAASLEIDGIALRLGAPSLPFADTLYDAIRPWRLDDLPDDLAEAALGQWLDTHLGALSSAFAPARGTRLPPDSTPPAGLRLPLEARNAEDRIVFALYADAPPPEGLAKRMGLTPPKPHLPAALMTTLDIVSGQARLPYSLMATLRPGDVIFMTARPDADTPEARLP